MARSGPSELIIQDHLPNLRSPDEQHLNPSIKSLCHVTLTYIHRLSRLRHRHFEEKAGWEGIILPTKPITYEN